MPGSPNISQKAIKPTSGITIKKEPSSPPKKDIKGSLEALRLGSSRLPSFRGPRDLTLSSLVSSTSASLQTQSRPKRTFVPNIPVRREKGDKVVESRSEKSAKKVPNLAKQERGKGKGRGKEREFIQTRGSLFGEGIAASPAVKRNSDYGGYGGGRDAKGGLKPGEMRMPLLNPDAANSINKEDEERLLNEIKRDDLIDDPDEEAIPDRDAPRSLPLMKLENDTKSIKNESMKTEYISEGLCESNEKKRVRIKQEPGLETMETDNENQVEASPENFPVDSVAYSLENKKKPDFLLFQLPTSLPAYPSEEAGASSSSGKEARHDHDSNVNTGFLKSSRPRCTLDTLPEGQIGVIRYYKDGRAELRLGNHAFPIEKGVPVTCLQEVACVRVDKENNTGSMSILGHISDKFLVVPDFERMVNGLKKL